MSETTIDPKELRPGTVVRLKDAVIREVYNFGSVTVRIGGQDADWAFQASDIAEIVSQPETDSEKIERLEAENAALIRQLARSQSASSVHEANPTFPPDEPFKPWYPGNDLRRKAHRPASPLGEASDDPA